MKLKLGIALVCIMLTAIMLPLGVMAADFTHQVTDVTQTTVSVEWTGVDGANQYTVMIYNHGSSSAFLNLEMMGSSFRSATSPSILSANTTYDIQIAAHVDGNTVYTTKSSFTTLSDEPEFTHQVTEVTQTTATVEWTGVDGATQYTVQFFNPGSSTAFLNLEMMGSSFRSVTSPSVLSPNTTYEVRVAAIVGDTTEYTTRSSFTTLEEESDFTVDESTGTITGYTGNDSDITVPSSINGVDILIIGTGAFDGCSTIVNVTLESGITTIEATAFDNSPLLESISLPDSVNNIDSRAFGVCSSLTQISVNASNTNYVSSGGILFDSDFSTLVYYPAGLSAASYTIPNTVDTVGAYAFHYNQNIQQISIDSSVTTISDSAFYGCTAMTTANIPSNVTSIANNAFMYYTSGSNAVLPLLTIYGETGSYAQTYATASGIPFVDPNPPSEYTYTDNGNGTCIVTGYTGTDTVIEIPSEINGLIVTSIGDNAFENKTAITSVTIPNNVTSIGSAAFKECTTLTSIEIPDDVTTIGTEAFYNCSLLASITLPSELTVIEDMVFRNCDSITDITIPSNVDRIDFQAFYICDGITNITIPSGVESIGEQAFRYCTKLESVSLPDTVTTLGDYTFTGCSLLSSVILSNNINEISQSMFYDCINLTSITIPDNVQEIGANAFSGCKNLASIILPNSLTTIGAGAFYNCDTITTVDISAIVTDIGDYAFGGCDSLMGINVDEANVNYRDDDGVLYDYNRTVLIAYPPAKAGSILHLNHPLTKIAHSAFRDCKNLRVIIIPRSVNTISDYAFYNCNTINSITLPEGTTNIGEGAFGNCDNLRGITIDETTTVIASDAVDGCHADLVIYGQTDSYAETYAGQADLPFVVDDAPDGVVFDEVSRMVTGYTGSAADLVIPETIKGQDVTQIYYLAFNDCTCLVNVTLPDGVAAIYNEAFRDCTNLQRIYLPNSIEFIYALAFYNCTQLQSVDIPDNLDKIYTRTFYNCDSLTSVTIPGTIPEIDYRAFAECNNLSELIINDGVETIGDGSFNNCPSLETVIIPSSVTTIADNAFDGHPTTLKMYGEEESYAQNYAETHGIPFVTPCDLDESGVIDMLDMVILAQEYGGNNQEYDLNDDGIVNLYDLVYLARRMESE